MKDLALFCHKLEVIEASVRAPYPLKPIDVWCCKKLLRVRDTPSLRDFCCSQLYEIVLCERFQSSLC